jgi:UDP-2-acetamido-3-amino-2,3-dideoxy-glucuronate N-acetyltransferase
MKIHPLADVQTNKIGKSTMVWQYTVILPGASIGENCNINCHTFIENDVVIGNNVTVKSGVFLWDGLFIEDNVFIGPNATFTNDKFPRSKQYPDGFQKTRLANGSSIGANATILGGVTVGSFAIVGAGSVVTKDVPAHALVVGNPAKQVAWVDETGHKLVAGSEENTWIGTNQQKFKVEKNQLVKL